MAKSTFEVEDKPVVYGTQVVQVFPTDELVEQWFVETFHNCGLDVTLYNRFAAAKNSLKTRLAALVNKEM